jgi:hypothetical protein
MKATIVISLVIAFGIVGYVIYLNHRAPIQTQVFTRPSVASDRDGQSSSDALCNYVSSSLQLRCVVILGSDNLLGPGAVVEYPVNATAYTRVPLPNADLFSSTCVVPGEQITALLESLRRQKEQNAVSIPDMTYTFNRSFQLGVQLPIPQLDGLTLKAGPKINELQNVTLKVPQAWVKLIDEFAFADVLARSGIRQPCIDRLLASQYRVISKALIGHLGYEFTDKNGQSYSFSAAADKGQLKFTGGTGTDITEEQAAKLVTREPVVLAVDFLDPNILKQQPKLNQSVVYSSGGMATVSVSGSGGDGHLAPSKLSNASGSAAVVREQGGESSECDGGFDRTKSAVDVSAMVRPVDDQTVDFVTQGGFNGGHYATGNCIFGRLANISGHDTGVDVQIFFTAVIRAIVRSDYLHSLTVESSGMPKDSNIGVRDPVGQILPPQGLESRTAVPQEGVLKFALHGAGVYAVELSSSISRSISGAGGAQISNMGRVRVTVQ